MDRNNIFIDNNPAGNLLIPILVAIFVIFISIVIFLLYRSKKAGRNVVLLGLCDSGKTLIFSQILHSKCVATHTSIKENKEEYVVNNKSLQLIDIPGHERLRDKFFEQFKTGSRGIVFVIDSSTLQKKVRDVAEYLYVILCDPVVQNVKPKILILCNKQDDFSAKSSSVIRSSLEKELNTLRVTKSSQLESVGGEENRIFLGKEDKDFEFSQLAQFNIEFGESQVKDKNSVDLDSLKKWLAKIA